MSRAIVLLREKGVDNKTIRLIVQHVSLSRIPCNSSCSNRNYKGYDRGRTMKNNNVLNSPKAETPEKPKGCTVLSEIAEKPVRLLYRNARQFSLLVS